MWDAEKLHKLRASNLLFRMRLAVEQCEDAETVEELDDKLIALGHVVDAISDLLLGLEN